MDTATPTNTNLHAVPNAPAQEAELPVSPNAMAALSYAIAPVAIAALVMRDYQKNAHVRFAATQALLFFATGVLGSVAISMTFGLISLIGNIILSAVGLYGIMSLFFLLSPVVTAVFFLGMLATLIALVVTASQGKKMKLPVLGNMAERFASR